MSDFISRDRPFLIDDLLKMEDEELLGMFHEYKTANEVRAFLHETRINGTNVIVFIPFAINALSINGLDYYKIRYIDRPVSVELLGQLDSDILNLERADVDAQKLDDSRLEILHFLISLRIEVVVNINALIEQNKKRGRW